MSAEFTKEEKRALACKKAKVKYLTPEERAFKRKMEKRRELENKISDMMNSKWGDL